MNRANYFDYIEEKLSTLATRIEVRSKLNILDLHLHSENFYLHFLNELFDWQLKNLNAFKLNTEAIDLIDSNARIAIQVSATASKQKVESALSKNLSAYGGYTFKFVSISKDASKLRIDTFSNPHNLVFNPKSDILDISSILKIINVLGIGDLQRIYAFIKNELGREISPEKIETNLATIINILAKEDWSQGASNYEIKPFEVERKIEYNNLNTAKNIIDDYKVHNGRVDKTYSEFSKQGANKSISVLASIRKFYSANKAILSDDDLFFKIIDCVVDRIQKSANYDPIPYDELELCVNILVVDAFIRCKIFENPGGYTYAPS